MVRFARTRAGWALLLWPVLGACSSEPPGDLFAASRADRSAPAIVRHGPAVRCGDFVQGREPLPAPAVSCFSSAIGKADAELAVLVLSEEGDPVVQFFSATPGQPGYDVFVNASWDPLGAQGWYRLRCRTPPSFEPDLIGCDLV